MGNEIRTVLDALASSWMPKVALGAFVICFIATALIGLSQNYYAWMGVNLPTGLASIDVWKLGMVIGTSGTATAFLVTLYVADRNYRRSREHVPNLTMDLQVQRVEASAKYDAVIATLNAKNTGTGLCSVDEVQWHVRTLSPYDDDSIDEMLREFDNKPDSTREIEFPWHEVKEESTKLDIDIEPNETEQMTQDFIIPAEVTAIIVSAWVSNISEPKMTEGWYRRTVHSTQEA